MPEITCTCGKAFTAARANAKFCSDKCRKRTRRSGNGDTPEPAAKARVPRRGPIETAAMRELSDAGRLRTSLGLTALALARRLDNGLFETGSAYASLSKEFEAKLAAATRGANRQTAPQQLQDEVARRRAMRGA